MSCLLYLLLFCVVCVILLQANLRVKLKARYGLTFVAISSVLFVYFKFSVCGNPIVEFEETFEKWNLKPNNPNYEENYRINRRELFDAAESKVQDPSVMPLDPKNAGIFSPILSADPGVVQIRNKGYYADPQEEIASDPENRPAGTNM